METINRELKDYIEQQILPIYKNNDSGHGIEHIQYVVKRSLRFASQYPNINLDMVYAIASFHDIAHHIDKDNHEVLSAKLFYENEKMKDFFDDKQRKIIKEAIEDHRASLEHEPRSDYGKIISSADRTTSIDSVLQRTHSYTTKHYPDLDLFQMAERSYNHMFKKYGGNGYAKNYCYDEEYEQFKRDVETISKNKWEFTKKYLEVNRIMDLKEKAKIFAINAHMGQTRKSEPDKPMIIHPISVGMLLEEYGYDEAVVAAGYLHDVVEDTKYTIEDIKKEFGDEVANLVMSASEPDKSLSWEERKAHTIEETKKLPLRNKLVICADKINNLEDLMLKFQKSGKRDFSAFKRGEKQQKWYYTSVYESLISGENENLPIFKRLKNVLDIVFAEKEDLYLRDTIFDDNREYYEKLNKLHAQKVELQKLKALCALSKPFVIEFSGTPRTGKTTTIRMILGILKKDSGEISWNGKEVKRKNVNFGYLPEERGVYPKTKIYDQMMYFAELKGMKKEKAIEALNYWAKRLEVEQYINMTPEKLSKGNQQKIQFITSIIHNPELVVLDEPFSGLDPVNTEILKSVIIELIKTYDNIKGVDSIYSTPSGYKYIVFITIQVDGNLTTFESHKIADDLEKDLKKLDKISHAIVHVNPI